MFIKRKGYISIEIIIIGAVILSFGLFAVNRFVNGGQSVSDKQSEAFKDTANTIYQGVGSGSIIPGGGGLPGGGMKPSTLGLKPNDMITIEGRKYVVLEDKNSNQYLIMDIDGIGRKQFNIDRNGQDPSKCGIINGSWKYDTCNNQYENSNIDIELNETYYNSLSFKDAIIEQDIQQSFYSNTWSNPNYKWVSEGDTTSAPGCTGTACVKQPNGNWLSWDKHTPIKGEPGMHKFENKGSKRSDGLTSNTIKRKIYLPSINEISSIANVNDQYDMDKFLRNSSGGRLYVWFRDSRFRVSANAMNGNYNDRSLSSEYVHATYITARPTFVIDLTKAKFSKDNKVFIPAYEPQLQRNETPGTIINIENEDYIVIDNKGNNLHLIMKANAIGGMQYNDKLNSTYAGSTVDKYLNERFYNSLPENIKSAIVETEISQDFYPWPGNPQYQELSNWSKVSKTEPIGKT